MTPEEKELLREAVNLSRENNQILHKMRRGQFLANIISYVKWIILIIITVWSWLILQPYFEKMSDLYSQVEETTKKVDGALDVSGLQNLTDMFRIGIQ